MAQREGHQKGGGQIGSNGGGKLDQKSGGGEIDLKWYFIFSSGWKVGGGGKLYFYPPPHFWKWGAMAPVAPPFELRPRIVYI